MTQTTKRQPFADTLDRIQNTRYIVGMSFVDHGNSLVSKALGVAPNVIGDYKDLKVINALERALESKDGPTIEFLKSALIHFKKACESPLPSDILIEAHEATARLSVALGMGREEWIYHLLTVVTLSNKLSTTAESENRTEEALYWKKNAEAAPSRFNVDLKGLTKEEWMKYIREERKGLLNLVRTSD